MRLFCCLRNFFLIFLDSEHFVPHSTLRSAMPCGMTKGCTARQVHQAYRMDLVLPCKGLCIVPSGHQLCLLCLQLAALMRVSGRSSTRTCAGSSDAYQVCHMMLFTLFESNTCVFRYALLPTTTFAARRFAPSAACAGWCNTAAHSLPEWPHLCCQDAAVPWGY